MKGRTIIIWVLSGILVSVIIGYSCFVFYGYFRGPRIIITNPKSGFSTTTPVITIDGQAIHTSVLAINDMETPVDLEGNFQSRLILALGYNIIKITAKDHYDRAVEKTIEINLLNSF